MIVLTMVCCVRHIPVVDGAFIFDLVGPGRLCDRRSSCLPYQFEKILRTPCSLMCLIRVASASRKNSPCSYSFIGSLYVSRFDHVARSFTPRPRLLHSAHTHTGALSVYKTLSPWHRLPLVRVYTAVPGRMFAAEMVCRAEAAHSWKICGTVPFVPQPCSPRPRARKGKGFPGVRRHCITLV